MAGFKRLKPYTFLVYCKQTSSVYLVQNIVDTLPAIISCVSVMAVYNPIWANLTARIALILPVLSLT